MVTKVLGQRAAEAKPEKGRLTTCGLAKADRGQLERRAQRRRYQTVPSAGGARAQGPGFSSQEQVDHEHRPVEYRDLQPHQEAGTRDPVLGEHIGAAVRLEPPLGRRCGAEGRPVTVQGTRPRRPGATPAREPEAEREVDVLPVGEKPLVEAAELHECVRAVGGRAAARAHRLGRLRQLLQRTIPEHVPRPQRGVELDPGGVDEPRRRPLQQDAGDHADPPVGERLEQALDELGLADDVVVDQHDHVGARRFLGAAIDRAPEADVVGVANDGDAWEAGRKHLGGAVGRRVVDDDDFHGHRLGLDARERLREQTASVPRRDDDGCAHEVRHYTEMSRVVMWSTDPVGERMAGPGIRYHRLSMELAKRFDVTLVAPGDGVAGAPYTFRAPASAGSAGDLDVDVVVAQNLPLGLARKFRRRGVRVIYDLYAPALVEAAAKLAGESESNRQRGVRYEEVVATTRVALLLGDAFICASERQRDHWLGALAGLGRVTPAVYAADPALRSLVAVVPFGLDVASRQPRAPVAKGALPGIRSSDRLLLWGGGVWNWFDPLTVIRAVGRLAERRDDVKLLFLGMAHPSTAVGAMSMADRAVALAAELGLEGSTVFFNRAWVPYAEREAWFAEADLGVSAHPDSFETRLAFRTRLLDHIAAATPLVVTRGDVIAELVEARGMGRVVDPGDVDGWVTALEELLDDDDAYAAARTAVTAAQDELSWSRVAAPLAELIERVAASPPRSDGSGNAVVARAALTLARASLGRRGFRATVAAAGRAISSGNRR